MKNTVIIILFIISTLTGVAQNFVPNPGFEDTVYCPTGGSQMTAVQNWDNPVNQQPGSTTDYYNTCGYNGITPRSGNAYAGFISYYTIFTAREYAQIQLTQPLLPNKCYVVEMWARASLSGYLISDLGMLLGDTAIEAPNGTFIGANPQISTTTVIDTATWTLIRDTLTNLGGMEWLTIGVFVPDANIGIIQATGIPSAGAGFYIDDVSITELVVDTLPLTTLQDTTICAGENITLTAPLGYGNTHRWFDILAPGNPLGATNNINVSPGITTSYVYQVGGNCSNYYFDTVTVTVINCNGVTADFNSSNTNICVGDCINFTDLSLGQITNWTWSFLGASTTSSSAQNPTDICYNSIGSFDVQLIVTDGANIDTLLLPNFITVNSFPDTETSGNQSIDLGESVQISAFGGTSYVWQTSIDISCTLCQSPIVSPTQNTWYYVTITNSAGCSSIDSLLIEVNDNGNIYLPNAFSPDGDGMNDVFYVKGNGIKSFNLEVYNRWGQNIFKSNSIDNGWNGTFNGKELNQGVFVYTLKAELYNSKIIKKVGSITLLK